MERINRSAYRSTFLAYNQEITQPLYDYQQYKGGGFTGLSFFQIPIGAQGKTMGDTNMHLASELPADNMHFLTGIRVLCLPDWPATRMRHKKDEQDVRCVLSTGYLRLRIANRIYLEDGPLCKFPACFPTYERDPLLIRSAVRKTRGLRVAKQAYYSMVPVYINSHQPFMVELCELPPVLNAPVRLGVILDGRRVRPCV